MKRWLFASALTLCGFGSSLVGGSLSAAEKSQDAALDQVSVRKLAAGQEIAIATHSRVYRGHVVDPQTGEMELALSRDGERFGEPVRLFVLGATAGAQPDSAHILVRMGKIRVGDRMELGLGSREAVDRAISDPVLDIRVNETVAGSFAGAGR